MPCRLSERSKSHICRREAGSKPMVGSSRINISGSVNKARHSISLRFIPPESLRTVFLRCSARPQNSRSSPLRAFAFFRSIKYKRACSSIIWSRFISPRRELCCVISASLRLISCRLRVSSSPSITISPSVGSSSVDKTLISVVFPAPFGPSNPKNSPVSIVNETSSRAFLFACG